jgi:hypothetical protein
MCAHFGHMRGKVVKRDATDVVLVEAGRQAQRLAGCRHAPLFHRGGRCHRPIGYPED